MKWDLFTYLLDTIWDLANSASNGSLIKWKIALFHKKKLSSDRKMLISDFQSQFCISKIIQIFLFSFFFKNINLETLDGAQDGARELDGLWSDLESSLKMTTKWSLETIIYFFNIISVSTILRTAVRGDFNIHGTKYF